MSNTYYILEHILYIFQISRQIIEIVSLTADCLYFVYHPHWDALPGIAWRSKKQFAIISLLIKAAVWITDSRVYQSSYLWIDPIDLDILGTRLQILHLS